MNAALNFNLNGFNHLQTRSAVVPNEIEQCAAPNWLGAGRASPVRAGTDAEPVGALWSLGDFERFS